MRTLKRKPCKDCLYKLGEVHTVENPCPTCQLQGYPMAEVFAQNNSAYRDKSHRVQSSENGNPQ